MTKIVYVVVKRGYEYNDNTYDLADAANPVKAYALAEDANKEAERLSLDFATEWTSGNYSSSLLYFLGWQTRLEKENFDRLPITDQLARLRDYGVWFYAVKEVELED